MVTERKADLEGHGNHMGLLAMKGTRMKRRFARAFFALAVALLFAVAPAGATTSVTMDGVWWQGLSESEKIVAVEGMLAAFDSAYTAGAATGINWAVVAFKVPAAQVNKATDAIIREELHAGPEFSKTFGVYRDEINVWYEAHPKRTAISPDMLLSTCFADKPSFLPGQTCDDLGSTFDK